MINNSYVRGFIFSVLMLSAVLAGMTTLTAIAFAGPVSTIEVIASDPSPQVNQTISISATARDVNGSISTSSNGTMQFLANDTSLPSAPITNGIATTTFKKATAGPVIITAIFNGTQGSTNVVFNAPALSLSANPATVTAGTATNVTFTVSPAVSGATVTLAGVATGSGTTDANGKATISVNATAVGTITAKASISGYTSGTATVTAELPTLTVSANPTTVTAGSPTNVTFTVSPAVSGATVTLTGVATGSGTTDANGKATINVNATAIGTITAKASMNGYTSGTATVTAGLPTLTISANPTKVTAGTATNVTFTVSPAVSGATVTLTGVATGSGTTDANGSATIIVNATGTGTITAKASMSGYTSRTATVTAGLPTLTVSANPTKVTAGTATNVTFTVSPAVSGATVTLTGVATGSGTTDANGSATIIVNATGTGTITAKANMNGYTGLSIDLAAIVAIDTTPPDSITNLTMENNGTSWIKWNWTNPPVDFSYVAIWINNGWHNASAGAYYLNTSFILSLLSGTEYTIATHTVDTSGNVNSTWVNLTNSTLPNTPVSTSPITVTLPLNSSVTFASVIVEGNTVETIDASHKLPLSSYILVGDYHNISTTAKYNQPVTVSVKYNIPLPPGYTDSDVRLYHWNDSTSQWDNVTTSSGSGMVTGLVSSLSPFVPAIPAKPKITKIYPTDPIETIVNIPQAFNITVDQTANVTWNINSNPLNYSGIIPAGNIISFTNTPSSIDNYNVSVSASNDNGTDTEYWNWSVHPTTFFTGNRIWDGNQPLAFSKKYTWTPQSFSGFYYNAKDDVGSESLTMILSDYTSRTIATDNLVYSTSSQEVSFTHSDWGKYQVIGFMADKYFAGYSANTSPTNTRPTTDFSGISALAQGGLHRVLIDDDTKRTIAVGGTIALQDGYVLKATDIDLNARTMLISLLKDGNEVDVSPLSADQTYVYTKNVGGVENLPLIMVRFDNVFSGQELQVAFMKGLFQISEDTTTVHTGDRFGNMEISSVSQSGIQMTNSANIGLSKGSTVDIMGNLKIKVANNDSVRFALTVDNPSNQEVRSTVYRDSDSPPITEWTPYNFGMNIADTSLGFYYNLDDGVGSEDLKLNAPVSGRTIPQNGLVYSTSPQEVPFTYTGFGKYQAIGFMADNYFAGYTSNTGVLNGISIVTRPSTNFNGISTIANGNLHKVLIDDDTRRTIAVGGTIALQEGYVLKATDIDLNARSMLLSLMKDGTEVDVSPLSAGETYVYTKTVGGTESLPLIMVRFESVFSGNELQVAFLRGMFQISENPTTISAGNQFGNMEVSSVSRDSITMSNSNSIGLSPNTNNALMGNIRLKVADNAANLRFYFAVDVTAEMIQNQLVIDAPTKAMAGDTIKINVTAGGSGIGNATINIGNVTGTIGTTDRNGSLNYTLPRNLMGTYSITASMTGYEKATRNIEIEKYIDYTLSMDAPSQANQFETITIKVLYNGTAMEGATVIFDNTTVGTSDSNGELAYKLETSGTHSISASKKSYITVARDIDIRAPYSEFKGLDINITPNPGFAGEAFQVRANISNVGTKSDSLQVDLIINGTSVDNKTITLGAKEKVEVNFTRTEAKAGNVTVEIMGQSMLFEAKGETHELFVDGRNCDSYRGYSYHYPYFKKTAERWIAQTEIQFAFQEVRLEAVKVLIPAVHCPPGPIARKPTADIMTDISMTIIILNTPPTNPNNPDSIGKSFITYILTFRVS